MINIKNTLHKQAHNIFLVIVALGVIFSVVYTGIHYFNKSKSQTELALQLQQEAQLKLEIKRAEKDKTRDDELALLKQQLLDLQNKPTETKTITNTVEVGAKDPVANIVKKWSPRVAHIECSWFNSTGALYAKGSGSATLVDFTVGIRAITNKHVMVYKNYLPKSCTIELNSGASYPITISKENVSIGQDEDWAYVTLPKDDTLSAITKQNITACKNVEVGDKLLVLGYPKIGSKSGLTVTEGIVSANDKNYYITSAKIDKGNSGGAAISVEGDCYLGIPSATVVGSYESLGRILKASFVIGG